VEALTTRL
jgi:cation diffusion facilitator CzcD-associated flavoprotein CzcO